MASVLGSLRDYVYVGATTNDQWARPACLPVSLSKTKPCELSLVTSLYERFKA